MSNFRNISPSELIAELENNSFRFTNEKELQDAVRDILVLARAQFSKEYVLSPRDRIDFLLSNGLGIEIKIAGSLAEVTRQLHRYAQFNEVRALLLVTTKALHMNAPRLLNGKSVDLYFASLRRAF